MSGVSLYLTDEQLEGLRWGLDHLYTICEAASIVPPELTQAINALSAISEKGFAPKEPVPVAGWCAKRCGRFQSDPAIVQNRSGALPGICSYVKPDPQNFVSPSPNRKRWQLIDKELP